MGSERWSDTLICLKHIHHVVNMRLVPFPRYRDHVESTVATFTRANEEISFCGRLKSVPFTVRYRFFRLAVASRFAGLHFNEHQRFSILGNNVNLATPMPKVPLNDPVSPLNQMRNSKFLPYLPPFALVHCAAAS
jgi:hypothetical protein